MSIPLLKALSLDVRRVQIYKWTLSSSLMSFFSQEMKRKCFLYIILKTHWQDGRFACRARACFLRQSWEGQLKICAGRAPAASLSSRDVKRWVTRMQRRVHLKRCK